MGQSGSEIFEKYVQGEPRLLSHELLAEETLDREFLTGERQTGSDLDGNELGLNQPKNPAIENSKWMQRRGQENPKQGNVISSNPGETESPALDNPYEI